jgi:catechol 2,3-dioxygenase
MHPHLPDDTHVGAVHLQVSNLARSTDYYGEVLGLDELARDTGQAWLGVAATARPLVHLVEQRGATAAPRRGRFGLYHFAVLLPDRAALGRFASHVLGLGLQAGMADHAVSEALYLTDPDGLGIEVYADRPRTSWKYRGGELVMVTDPLDIAGVIASGEGQRWSGTPPGTTMGHVHLHVGDLAKAENFYAAVLGLNKTVWSYPSALFFSAGGYHHHLGTNVWSPGPSAGPGEARLLEWELVVPRQGMADIVSRFRAAGIAATEADDGVRVPDPWGTQLHVAAEDRTWRPS